MTNGNFQSSNYAYDLYLYCEWSSKSNTEGNYSDVTITTYLNYYSLYMSAGTNDCSAGVSGVKINQWTGPDIFSGSPGRVKLGSTTVRMPHNADGSKTCTLSAAYRLNATISGSYIGTMETSASVTLDNIPRASSISSITSSVSMDENHSVSVGISSASASFNHKIQINLAGTARYISGIVSDRTITYKIPKSWCSYLPNAVSGTATAYLYTYSGSTQIGSPKSATFTVTVPDDVKPTIGGLTAERIDNGVPTAWGLYVRSKSKAKLKMTGTAGSYGSSVQSMSISGGGYSSASSELTTGTLNTAGTNTFTATVTDSRGRKSTGQTSISVVDYSTPAITGYTVNRCLDNGTANDDGTYLSVKAAGTYASCSGKNTMAITVKYRPVGGSWSSETALASGTAKVIGGGEIDVNKSYETDISITDSFGTWHAYPPNIPTSFSTIDFRAGGKGVTIGGAAEEDGLIVKMPAKFTKDFHADVAKSNRMIITNTSDVSPGAVGTPPLLIGNPSGQHIEIDNNEIISKTNGTTGGTLYMGNGGSVVIDAPSTFNNEALYKSNVRLNASASETSDLIFSRPTDYEYEAHMDLIRNSIRLYTYDKSGTYTSPFTFRLNDAAFITAGRLYGLGGTLGSVMNKQDLKLATGAVVAKYTANTQLNIEVTFPANVFTNIPAVFITNMSAVPTEFTRVPTVTNVTKTGCTLCLYRITATQTEVRWFAVGS